MEETQVEEGKNESTDDVRRGEKSASEERRKEKKWNDTTEGRVIRETGNRMK